ncbi:MAG: Ig domain-containing protein [Gemmatimonadaceae bacterium]|nr:Ig domain-containing protein [Gemmatimonadaceae bacterium]
MMRRLRCTLLLAPRPLRARRATRRPRALTLVLFLPAAIAAACSSDSISASSVVASVNISPSADTVTIGATTTLTVTVEGADGKPLSGSQVFWNTEDPSIATVSSDGVVTGVAPGSVRIAASAAGKSAVATVTVLPRPVASVSVSPATASIALAGTVQLTATTRDADGHELSGRTVTWSTSDPTIATVSASGRVTGTGAGQATITATSEGKRGTARVTVTLPEAATVVITPVAVAIIEGQTFQLTAVARDEPGHVIDGAPITWTSSEPKVATISSTGLVTGKHRGVTNITAHSGHATAHAQVAVAPKPK